MPQVIHSIHFPVSAKSFVMPVVAALIEHGVSAELWFQPFDGHNEIMRQITVPHRHIEVDSTVNPFFFTRRLANLRGELQRSRATVLHAHQMRASFLPLLAARLENIPVRVYHNHGLPYLGYKGPLRLILRTFDRINIGLATHVLLVSHSNLEAASTDGLLPPGKGKVLANGSAVGIDLGEFPASKFDDRAKIEARRQFGIETAKFVLAYVGRPVARKGFHRLLAAWRNTGLGSAGGALLIAGCTREECRQAVGVELRGVCPVGYVPDLNPLYAASDAVTLPSDHEGFPYSLLEGAAAGRALHGTDIPGIRSAIEANVTGVLYPRGDQAALETSLKRLAADPELCRKLGTNARRRVEQLFQRNLVLSEFLSFYDQVLGSTGTERTAKLQSHRTSKACVF